jgi:hypothetical protein
MDSMDTFHLRTLNFRIFRLLKSAFIPFWLCYSQDIHSPGQGHSSTRAAIGLSEESRVLQPWQQLTKSQPESPGKCDQISCWHQDSKDIVLQDFPILALLVGEIPHCSLLWSDDFYIPSPPRQKRLSCSVILQCPMVVSGSTIMEKSYCFWE